MSDSESESVESALLSALTDSFNKTLRALEDAGAIDSTKLRGQYQGIGTKYYDLVTRLQSEFTVSARTSVYGHALNAFYRPGTLTGAPWPAS